MSNNTHQSVHGSLVGMRSPVAYVTPSITHSVTVNKGNAGMKLTLSEMSHTVADIQIMTKLKFGLVETLCLLLRIWIEEDLRSWRRDSILLTEVKNCNSLYVTH